MVTLVKHETITFAISALLYVTAAQTQCEACGFTGAVGSLHLYAAAMGAVLRCTHCNVSSLLVELGHDPHAIRTERFGPSGGYAP
jgi:hypothetical protein